MLWRLISCVPFVVGLEPTKSSEFNRDCLVL